MKRGTNLFSNLFLAPAFIIYTVFVITAVILTFFYSTTEWNGVGAKVFNWFANYRELVTDRDYWTVTKNTGILVLLALLIQTGLALVLAYLVSKVTRGYKFFRSVYFLPVVVTTAATAVMFTVMYNENGPLNVFLDFLHLDILKRNWLSDGKIVLFSVALPQLWQFLGIQFIILLTGIQSIPEEIIESAQMDGATDFRILFSIVIPMITEVIQICVIYTVTGALKSFNYAWIMTYGGPGLSSSYISVLMFQKIFMQFDFGYGSTIAISLLIYSLVFTVIFKGYFSRRDALN
jgi:raffinose/stachyose/melibiose transport system permease protein